MRNARFAVAVFSILALACPGLRSQESAKPEAKVSPTLLKVQVVISEAEGERKVGNLPYTFFLTADNPTPPYSLIRVGTKVPVYTGKEGVEYIDVGTNIDARGRSEDNGLFVIGMRVDRSWVDGDVLIPIDKSEGHSSEQSTTQFKQPIIHQFRTDLAFKMRDGQTVQSTQAADPVSGRVLTISVTINVVK